FGASAISAPVSISVNSPPTVSITSPPNGSGFATPANIVITASATDNGSVALVEFFASGSFLGSRTNSPYTITWTNVPIGSYSIVARATDNQGLTNSSSPVNITVHLPTANFADNFANRGQISAKTNFVRGTNTTYTREPGEPNHWQFASGTNSAWISWTAPDSATYSMDTQGSSFDTVMAVYTGDVLTNL